MNSRFNDFTKYKLLSKSEEKDDTFKYYIEHYLDLINNCQVKRTLKYRIVKVSRNKEEAIQERRNWESFNIDKKKDDTTMVCEDVWMEYNPELLKSKKSTDYLYKNNITKQEEIHVFEGYEKILEDKLAKMKISSKNNKYLETLKALHKNKNTSCSNEKKIIKKSGYIPPHLRNKNLNSTSNNNKNNDRISVRLSNFMGGTTEDEIKEWIKQFKLPRYKLYFPRYPDNSIKDFVYINLQYREDIDIVINLLNGQKMNYSIISVIQSK